MDADLKGRLRKFRLRADLGLVPVFEAVVNAIHAVRAARRSDGLIQVEVIREAQLPGFNGTRILDFSVSDNGIGFNQENFDSFKTIDSQFKLEIGGQGVGRLSWLKAFREASIDSAYRVDGGFRRRVFSFSPDREIYAVSDEDADCTDTCTRVRLLGFRDRYAKKTPTSLRVIAERILSHCVVHFMQAGQAGQAGAFMPRILVEEAGCDSIDLRALFEETYQGGRDAYSVEVEGNPFEVLACRVKPSHRDGNRIILCAHSLPVKRISLVGQVNNIEALVDGDERFAYLALINGEVLDESVTQERDDFKLDDGLFAESDLTLETLKSALIDRVSAELSSFTEAAAVDKFERIRDYVETNAKEYRLLLEHRREQLDQIPARVISSPAKLEEHLLAEKQRWQREVRATGARLLETTEDLDNPEYRDQYSRFVSDMNALGVTELAEYVAHRRAILELLRLFLQRKPDGRFRYEKELHELFFPMRHTSTTVSYEKQNLWILDERLTYHRYLASDKTLKATPGLETSSTLEPDILVVFREGSEAAVGNPIALVEFKRPGRKDGDPIRQVVNYIKRIREARETTDPGGRPIRVGEGTPFFCYVVADLTDEVVTAAETSGFQASYDGLSYFGYIPAYKAYFEVLSYDKVLQLAEMRNRVFFEKLNLPTAH